jgi:hypothetical protein
MASPLQTGKKSVNLASSPARVSRIRRDPPPIPQKIAVRDPDERDARTVVIGIVSFALAIVIITIALSSAYGWSPSQYNIEINNL